MNLRAKKKAMTPTMGQQKQVTASAHSANGMMAGAGATKCPSGWYTCQSNKLRMVCLSVKQTADGTPVNQTNCGWYACQSNKLRMVRMSIKQTAEATCMFYMYLVKTGSVTMETDLSRLQLGVR